MTDKQYQQKVRQIEELIEKVENPDTLIPEAEKMITKAKSLLKDCYAHLLDEPETEQENDIR